MASLGHPCKFRQCKLHRATCRRFDTIAACDGQTNGQTGGQTDRRNCCSIAARCKNVDRVSKSCCTRVSYINNTCSELAFNQLSTDLRHAYDTHMRSGLSPSRRPGLRLDSVMKFGLYTTLTGLLAGIFYRLTSQMDILVTATWPRELMLGTLIFSWYFKSRLPIRVYVQCWRIAVRFSMF